MIKIFTGLVEEMGEVLEVKNGDKALHLKVKCNKVLEGAKLGDSIATNGTFV